MTPEEMVSRLLYRDGLMLVIDKPAGLAVHAGPPNARDQNESARGPFRRACVSACRARRRWPIGSTATPPAAWCSAATARRWPSSAGCSSPARSRRLIGLWSKAPRRNEQGTIELPLGRLDVTRGWWMKHDPEHGQPAVTRWKVLGKARGTSDDAKVLTWLALEPLTGRTHQLRVHCAEMGWPILGDSIYGNAPRHGGPTLHLQAREIVVPLYKNRPPIRVTAPVPAHMREALTACGWSGKENDIASAEAAATIERGANTASP